MKFFKTISLLSLCASLYAGGSYSIALVNMNMDYREYNDNGVILDSEKADSILGFELGYGFDLECNDDGCPNLELKALVLNGDTDYVGSYLGSGQPYGSVKSTTSNLLYDISLDWTQTDKVHGFGVKYGVGLGYHSWYRELSSTQNELYHWFYITPVLGLSKEITANLNIATLLKYKYGMSPKMKANTIADEFRLGRADTFEVNVPITYSYTEQIDFFAAYIYSRQTIKKSNYIQQGSYIYWEPDSTTNDNYLKIGATFRY